MNEEKDNKQDDKTVLEMLKSMDLWNTFVHIKGSETSGKKEGN